MREIKFRGKPKMGRYNLEHSPNLKEIDWVYGYLVKSRGDWYILQDYNEAGYDERWETCEWVQVISETAGQFTGLRDKMEKEIYEGDIFKYTLPDMPFAETDNPTFTVYIDVVEFVDALFEMDSIPLNAFYKEGEVIGNYHDNTELISYDQN